MKLNDFQYEIITRKLQENNWEVYSPDPHTHSPLPPPKNYEIYTHPENDLTQKLIIHNQELSLGVYHPDRFTWENILDFIELKSEIISGSANDLKQAKK